MQRWRSAVVHWLWVELCFDRRGVVNNSQMRAARERAKVAWVLCRRRMMQKLGGIAFYDSIDIVDAQLAFVDQEPICRWFAFEKRDCSFDSPNSADEGSDQQRDDTQMRDEFEFAICGLTLSARWRDASIVEFIRWQPSR